MASISVKDVPISKLNYYTFSKSPCNNISTLIFNTIYKDLEVLLNIPYIESIEVTKNYDITISFLGHFILYLYEGVLKIYDYNNDRSRVVRNEDLADKCNIVAEVLLHSMHYSDPPDDILYTLRKVLMIYGFPTSIPGWVREFHTSESSY